jgi:hypothetical protein
MAIKNPSATHIGGVAGNIAGVDTQHIYDAIPAGYAAGVNLTEFKLGGAAAVTLEDPRYAGKALQFKAITVLTANDALVNGVAGWYNRTGFSAAVGTFIVAVAA